MKILVLSDTHGKLEKARRVIGGYSDLDMVIHLGDYFRDAQKLAEEFSGIPMEYVYGNSDFMIGDTPGEKVLELGGKRIFITHGHRYSVKWDYNKLCRKAEETGADLLLFGHTHVAHLVQRGTFILLNPGSISDPRDDASESYAVIDIDQKRIEPSLIYL